MSHDLLLVALWTAVFSTGITACVVARRLGLGATYVRDCLHVGAGSWILGWPWWRSPVAPALIVGTAALATAVVPLVADRVRIVARFRDSVTGDGEGWSGLVGYTCAAFLLTIAGFAAMPGPAAAALAALALGDGVGGFVGRRFGRIGYRLPWGKTKSLEGSLTVAGLAAVGAAFASAWVGAPIGAVRALAAGAVAAVVEAVSPRSSDNLLLPAAVYAFLSAG